MKYYHFPASSNCRKVTATLDHLGIEHERVLVNPLKGEQKKPEFLALNPNGRIPVLEDQGLCLWESHAIMGYVASKKDNTLWPKDSRRYDIMRWFNWQAAHLGPAIGGVVFERLFKKLADLGEADEATVQRCTADFQQFGAVLNQHLKGRSFLVGDDLTLADFSVGSSVALTEKAELSLAEFPEVARWNAALNEIPAWRETSPKL